MIIAIEVWFSYRFFDWNVARFFFLLDRNNNKSAADIAR
jgi:hypothetical protein